MANTIKVIFGVSVLAAVLMISPFVMQKSYAAETNVDIRCKELPNTTFKCSGKQPMVGDIISYETRGGPTIIGEVTEVQDFDSPNDRRGQMTVTFGTQQIVSGDVLVVGNL